MEKRLRPPQEALEPIQTGMARRTLLRAGFAGAVSGLLSACGVSLKRRPHFEPAKPHPSESAPSLPQTNPAARIYTGFSGEGIADMVAAGEAVNKAPSIMSIFSSMGNEENRDFQRETLTEIRETHGAIPMVTLEPWDTSKGPEQPDYSLKEIASGRYDDYFRQWATDAKEWGHPFFLRFMHEMNGDWYPWSVQKNGNTPEEYVAAYRHVHDIFTEVGATNATWVWCVNTNYEGSYPVSSRIYPGDDYVDWVGLDVYEHDDTPEDPADIIGNMPFVLKQIARGKHLMFCELACVSTNPAEPEIIRRLLNVKRLGEYGVRAFVWFNWRKKYGGRPVDYRINDPGRPGTTEAYTKAVKSNIFAGKVGDISTSPIPPPGPR